jgi:hypothetical protein
VLSRVKGTLILRRRKRFYKAVALKRKEGNWWIFECRDLKTRQGSSFRYEMLGMLEAMDAAYSVMKDPKDIMLIDLDNQGKWKIIPKNQIDKLVKER